MKVKTNIKAEPPVLGERNRRTTLADGPRRRTG